MAYISEFYLQKGIYLLSNSVYLGIKGHFLDSFVKTLYSDSGQLLIAKDMKIPKASLPFLLQNMFLKREGLMLKHP